MTLNFTPAQILFAALIRVMIAYTCSNMAAKRKRNPTTWLILGLVFEIWALVAFYIILYRERSKKLKVVNESLSTLSKSALEAQKGLLVKQEPLNTLELREWYYLDEHRKQVGPVKFKLIKELIQTQKIQNSTFLWTTGMEDWKPLSELSYLQLVLNATN